MWKERLLKLLRLRDRGVLFKPRLYDYLYVPDKHAIGLVTRIHQEQITISFFPSLNNQEYSSGTLQFNPKIHLVIPSFENLIEFGHMLMKKEMDSSGSFNRDVVMGGSEGVIQSVKYKLYSRISSKFHSGSDIDDYGQLLVVIAGVMLHGGGSVHE